jgi:hypothetical protein
MSDTPRTDEAENASDMAGRVPAWFARQLERELNNMRHPGPSERDKQDAERYRWLRVRPSFIGWDWWNPPVPKEVVISPEFMDAAIDAAINRTPATSDGVKP